MKFGVRFTGIDDINDEIQIVHLAGGFIFKEAKHCLSQKELAPQ